MNFLRHKLIQPFIELLKQGVSPEKIALTVALGLSLGVIPVLGSTTMLCTLAAITLRLNLPAIMLVNGVVYPLQLALLVPFLRAGAWMFRLRSDSFDWRHFQPDPGQRLARHRRFVDRHHACAGDLADRRMRGQPGGLRDSGGRAAPVLDQGFCGKLKPL